MSVYQTICKLLNPVYRLFTSSFEVSVDPKTLLTYFSDFADCNFNQGALFYRSRKKRTKTDDHFNSKEQPKLSIDLY